MEETLDFAKMTESCCIYKCESGLGTLQNASIIYHKFPEDLDIRMEWMKIISCKKAWTPPVKDIESLRVCSMHFLAKDYTKKAGVTVLKPKAVPSVFKRALSPSRFPEEKVAAKRPILTPTTALSPKKVCTDAQQVIQSAGPTLLTPSALHTPESQNLKRIYFTDKSGQKLLLLTRPLSASPALQPITLVMTPQPKPTLLIAPKQTPPQLKTTPALAPAPTTGTKAAVVKPSTSKGIQPVVLLKKIPEQKKPADKITPAGVASASTTPKIGLETKSSSLSKTLPAMGSPSSSSSSKTVTDTTSPSSSPSSSASLKTVPVKASPSSTDPQKPSPSSATKKATPKEKPIKPLKKETPIKMPSSSLVERVTELKLLQEMALMKRELLKKTLQLTQMRNLVEKLKKERAIGSIKKVNALIKCVRRLQEKADNGDTAAIFLMDQIGAMDRPPRYSDSTIQQCALWRKKFAECYEYVRHSDLMQLPTMATITASQKTPGQDNGTNPDQAKRLQKQLAKMTEVQKVGSLVVQGIFSPEPYKPVKKSSSSKSETEDNNETREDDDDDGEATESKFTELGHYVTYQFVGLGLADPIILGRHFMKNVTDGDSLKCLTLRICADVEKIGLKIMRIIGDASLESIAMFGLMGDERGPAVSPQVVNPVSQGRLLYLTCDYVDVMRRVRSQFVQDNQNLLNAGRPISRQLVSRLYSIKSDVKDNLDDLQLPCRKSTFAKLGNCSKLTLVCKIFSPQITKGMRAMMDVQENLKNCDKTIEFLEMMHAWCLVMDICNSSPEVVPDGLSIEDKFLHAALLEWLEHDFLEYLENWRQSCSSPDTQFLSSTNYGALRLTTLAAVLYVRYLLESKFHLTNPKNFEETTVNLIVSEIIEKKKHRHLDPETITLVSADDDQLSNSTTPAQVENDMASSNLQGVSSPDLMSSFVYSI